MQCGEDAGRNCITAYFISESQCILSCQHIHQRIINSEAEQRGDITWQCIPFSDHESLCLARSSLVNEQSSPRKTSQCRCSASAHRAFQKHESLEAQHLNLVYYELCLITHKPVYARCINAPPPVTTASRVIAWRAGWHITSFVWRLSLQHHHTKESKTNLP